MDEGKCEQCGKAYPIVRGWENRCPNHRPESYHEAEIRKLKRELDKERQYKEGYCDVYNIARNQRSALLARVALAESLAQAVEDMLPCPEMRDSDTCSCLIDGDTGLVCAALAAWRREDGE